MAKHEGAGSSPHTRGALADIAERFPDHEDHPRIRGEHLMKYGLVIEAAGSSPHTRGARADRFDRDGFSRIIPAYAGSTSEHLRMPESSSDHPRIRGEHCEKRHIFYRHLGSSPHTRGARRLPGSPHDAERIIPAYAGSTCRDRWRTARR